ncbi:MAG: hypothetical protein ACOX7B_03400 [Christensenellales bacterium]|jgi:hypothetical protein
MNELLSGMLRRDGITGGTRQMTSKRLKAENVAPARISRKALENHYLCMGKYSLCHRCEVQCYYGRLYQAIKAKERKRKDTDT